jgi:hypothetical protein
MEEGTITKAGAKRVGIPEGTRVTFTRHPDFLNIAQDVFCGWRARVRQPANRGHRWRY